MKVNFNGKKALVRVDFNVPLDENFQVTDDTRIRGALPTINHILEQGGAVILMSHLGRPQKKLNEDGTVNRKRYTLNHVTGHLSKLLGRSVQFAQETVGAGTQELASALQSGDVLLLENTRFHKGEKKGDTEFAKQLASLADVYVNDAFGTAHRAHASTTTVAQFFDPNHKCFGFLIEKELKNAKRLTDNPKRPLTAIIGGAKVSDKIELLDTLIDQVDRLLIGGGMAYTFIKAQGGSIGNSLVEPDKVELAKQLLERARKNNVNLVLPEDSIVADDFKEDAQFKTVPSHAIEENWMGLDIGPKAREAFRAVILTSETILWNGPMGVFEFAAFATGTREVAQAVADSTEDGTFSLIGGGDSVAAINQMELADEVSYVSTGGGAMLELLEGKTLPGIQAIGR